MSESASVAITTVACILVVGNVVGNSFVCLVIRRNKDMRYVEGCSSSLNAFYFRHANVDCICSTVVFPVVD